MKPGGVATGQQDGVRRKARWVAAVLVAAGTFLALMVPPLIRGAGEPDTVERPLLPSTIAKYSWWTGSVSSSPIDAASLLYANGYGVELGDLPQAVVLGADGTSYRRLDLAEDLSTSGSQGDPAPSALSPDGTFVVVGSHGGTGEVHVVTLRDGTRRTIAIGEDRTAVPFSVTPDGRTALLGTADGEHAPYGARSGLGLSILDLETGELRDYPAVEDVRNAALSPDGTTIVVNAHGGNRLVDAADGRVISRVRLGKRAGIGGNTWSPDGSHLALSLEDRLAIVDPDSPASPRIIELDGVRDGYLLGWRDESTVLVSVYDYEGLPIYENQSFLFWVDADTGKLDRISSYVPNWTGASMGPTDAARDLIPQWEIADDLPVDRGVPPLTLALLTSLGTGLAAWIVLCVVFPLRRRPGPPAAPAWELVTTG